MKPFIAYLMAFVIGPIILLSSTPLMSQTLPDNFSIAVKGIYNGNSVILRWSPMDFLSWQQGIDFGYDLERYTIRNTQGLLGGEEYTNSRVVIGQQLRPAPESEWQDPAQTNDLYGVVAGCLYGDSLDLLPPGAPNILTTQNKSKETENRFGFSLFAADQSLTIAQMMGLAFIDIHAEPGCQYAYYATIHGKVVKGGFARVSTDSAFTLPRPSKPRVAAGDSSVTLTWEKNSSLYTSFVIEKSSNNGGSFQRLSNTPMLHGSTDEVEEGLTVYVDSLASNGTLFIYRVLGCSPFGMISQPSDTVHVVGKPMPLQVQISLSSAEEVVLGQMALQWSFPVDKEAEITGFDVLRAHHPEGPFTKLNANQLPAVTRTFTDISPLPLSYYVVKSKDMNGNDLKSFPIMAQINDAIAPSQPIVTMGRCDASGLVTLSWLPSAADDVAGYQVFMSSISTGDFVQITPTLFNDTVFRYSINLNTLSEDMYFTVRALDYHYNRSPMSASYLIKRPDIVPPSAPFIQTVNATMAGVYFEWILSNSEDVVKYEFQRQRVGAAGWINIMVFTPAAHIKNYTDLTASKRSWYRYRLVAVDEAGNRAGSRSVKAKPINNGLRDAILDLTGIFQGFSTFKTTLSWRYPKDVDLTGFQIYRSFDSLFVHSYKFFPNPLPSGSDIMFAVPHAGTMQYSFSDLDLDFKVPVQTNFSFIDAILSNPITPNKAVPVPTISAGIGQFVVPNPNIPDANPLSPLFIYYWVIAQFSDGSTSPVAGPVGVQVPQ